MKILHISADAKFIDMGLVPFDLLYPKKNHLILVTNNKKVKHVKYKTQKTISKKEANKINSDNDIWTGVDIVIFHSLFIKNIKIPKNIKSIWIGFGFDYYDLIFKNKSELLTKKTNSIKKSLETPKSKIKSIIKKITLRNIKNKRSKNKIMERIDIFCPVLENEYTLINWEIKNPPKLMDWNYGSMEDNWDLKIKEYSHEKNILIGNSATFSCNHIDGIDLILKNKKITSKLIIPLSYGNKNYSIKVKEYVKNNYPGKSIFLDDFLEFDKYMEILSSCKFAVMPHKRQQGLGNILSLLSLGAKVFLDEKNPLYFFLKNKGFSVFTLADIEKTTFLQELSFEKKKKNKDLLYEIWGKNSILEKTKKLIES